MPPPPCLIVRNRFFGLSSSLNFLYTVIRQSDPNTSNFDPSTNMMLSPNDISLSAMDLSKSRRSFLLLLLTKSFRLATLIVVSVWSDNSANSFRIYFYCKSFFKFCCKFHCTKSWIFLDLLHDKLSIPGG